MVSVVGSIAYVNDYPEGGISAIWVSDPANPILLGTHLVSAPAAFVALGGYLYVNGGAGGFEIVDVSNPTLPSTVGTWTTTGSAGSLAIRGDVVFLEDDAIGLVALDVSNPSSPQLLDVLPEPDIDDIAVVGDLVVIASSEDGLVVVDAGDPSDLVEMGRVSGSFYHVAASGSRAYTSGYRIWVVDLSTPATPVLLGGLEPLGIPKSLFADGDLIWSANFSEGVTAFPLQCEAPTGIRRELPASCLMSRPRPNPFRHESVVLYTLPREASVAVTILDVAGRVVRSWPHGLQSAGAHEWRWDGTDSHGKSVPSGVYFLRVRSGGESRSTKITRLR
jgi:hypothetical protein